MTRSQLLVLAVVAFGAAFFAVSNLPLHPSNSSWATMLTAAAKDEVPHVTNATFAQEVEQSTLPVLVDFYAPWCGPCKTTAPHIEKAYQQYKGKFKVMKCDTDKEGALSSKFGIKNIPTIIIFKNGKAIVTEIGGKTWAQIEKMIEDVLAQP